MEKKRIKVQIGGIVQGVGFRYFVEKNASRLGIKGYVKNLYDGQVETVMEGDEKALSNMMNLLHKGPSHSCVEKVNYKWEEYKNEFANFKITF